MPYSDIQKQLIYTTLTLNLATLYATENTKLAHIFPNLNCSELVSLELSLINASKSLVGLLLVASDRSVVKLSLMLYFMKKSLQTPDGGVDLVTVIVLVHIDVNKTLILSVLKKIMDKYLEFRQDMAADSPEQGKRNRLGEFKLYMNQIIKFEEMQYDLNLSIYGYGATGLREDSITPNQLVAAHEDVEEVRLMMLDNINKILGRGDKINLLVEQSERLQNLSLVFQKSAVAVRRRMWFQNVRFVALVASVALGFFYIVAGLECGYPFFLSCLHK